MLFNSPIQAGILFLASGMTSSNVASKIYSKHGFVYDGYASSTTDSGV